MLTVRIGELLQQANLITEQDIQRALEFQHRFGGRFGAVLIRMGAVSEDVVLFHLSQQLSIPLLKDLPDLEAVQAAVEMSNISKDWWIDQQCLAWKNQDNSIGCTSRDPLDPALQEIICQAFSNHEIHWYLSRNQDLDKLLDLFTKFQQNSWFGDQDDVGHLKELAEGAPVVEFVNNMLSQAMDQRASDVHVEPEERHFYVRYRVDGVLREHLNLPKERFPAIASRVKLISGLDISERRLPQDGRLNIRVSGQELDIRVSTLPGVHGESIVMRLLPKERQTSRLNQLGFAPDHLNLFQKWVNEPHGIVLVTGPTGSGKSTTLYATLDEINDNSRKIITVEDPVEYQLPHVTQVQAHSEIGYTFAHALRAILRQDPDIIMIGEIRDVETAEIAVQASLTGHMVLSTLHTNDAVSAFTRLIDMGIEPFLVATSVRAVQAQRLVRRLCPHCAQPSDPPKDILEQTLQLLPEQIKVKTPNWKKSVGCFECQYTGYKGRIGIYELVYITPELQTLILNRSHANEMRKIANQLGFRTLRHDGWIKAFQGITSLEEVMRVTENSNALLD